MAENANKPFGSGQPLQPSTDPLGQPLDFDLRGLGRRVPRTDANSRRVRTKKEKTLGPASMSKHEAHAKLAEYIEEYTGRVTKQGSSITTFTELWNVFCAVKSGRWSEKTKEDLRYLFAKHVLSMVGNVGNQPPREVTLTSLQLRRGRRPYREESGAEGHDAKHTKKIMRTLSEHG
jgi:hypothetical protein